MSWKTVLLLSLLCGASAAPCQSVVIPTGTPLAVKSDKPLPMRIGQPVQAQLLYPIYVDNRLVLPAGSIVSGSVTELRPDTHRRTRARFNADFTPFHIPVVQFNAITLPDGRRLTLAAGPASDGAPIYRIVPPAPHKGGFLRTQFSAAWQVAKSDVALFTAPGKADRLQQLLYSQLPYHPQRIEKGTAWTVETSAPLTVSTTAEAPIPTIPQLPETSTTWTVEANLDAPLSSATSKPGDPIRATVAQPILNPDHTIAVPQGAVLIGSVTRAHPARSFGRTGVLRFDFSQVQFPTGERSYVQATLQAADSSADQQLTAEGEAKPKPQDKLILPILLAGLAVRPLDPDGHHQLEKNAVGSNGLGFIGRIVGMAAGSPRFAAGLGFYQTAVSTWSRWIARGKQVTFAHDTRIVVQTTTRRSQPLRPDATPLPR